MRRASGTLRIFFEGELSAYFDSLHAGITARVHGETAEYLLNVDEADYTAHLVSEFKLDPLELHFDDTFATTREESIPSERFPRFNFHVIPGESYPKQVFTYHIPYSGTEDLLRYTPNPRIMNTHPVRLDEGSVRFDIIDFYGDSSRVKSDADQIMNRIRQQFENVKTNVVAYNEEVAGWVQKVTVERKAQLKQQLDVAQDLGFPIRKTEHVPETFRATGVRRKVMPKLSAPSASASPEPTLGADVYSAILKVINDTGKVFERLPSTYSEKDEEALRDHLILQLEPQFEGSTTGETFNKTGKTDILIRHEKSNVFVAECKWWDGPKKHTDTIDQLLGYLTWRDSKTAIVVFVDRKDFSNVLKQIDETTQAHPCFVRFMGSQDETWLNYQFHFPGDPDRMVKVGVLAFHMPKDARSPRSPNAP